MSEIFVSYSSLDKEKALTLVNDLRRRGYHVWVDQTNISGAMTWSSEIVEAINRCSIVLFLISAHSAQSHNCAKEIHLASEKQKAILPVALEEVVLPPVFEYSLAGIHPINYYEHDRIILALQKLHDGTRPSTLVTPSAFADEGDDKIPLAVLPFDDLSPGHDNDWFADGMMEDLISTLGSIDRFFVSPRHDVVHYKGKQPTIAELVADLRAQYIVAGSVQKAGDKIRIRVSLSETATHQQIWSEKYDGVFDDVFDLQDTTVRAITKALAIQLTPEEQERIDRRPTNSSDAYALFLKGKEHHNRASRADLELSLQLFEEAAVLDPSFSQAFLAIANTGRGYYRTFSRDPKILDRVEWAIQKAQALVGRTSEVVANMAMLSLQKGNIEVALDEAKEAVLLDKKKPLAYAALGFCYKHLGKWEEVAEAREQLIRCRKNDPNSHFSLIVALKELGDQERVRSAAERAIPVYTKYLRFNPDNVNARVEYANVLLSAQNKDEAIRVSKELSASPALDGPSLYNLACFFCVVDDPHTSFALLKRSVESGYIDIETMRKDPDLQLIHCWPEFNELLQQVNQKIAADATV